MTSVKSLLLCCMLMLSTAVRAEAITIAAASDLKFAMDQVISSFRVTHPLDTIDVVYGSSGIFNTQIQQGAPYDLYFSADIAFPRELAAAGFAASAISTYAMGRIVLWSASVDASTLTLDSLTDPAFTRIAIANPLHAPYGQRAEEALRKVGLWDSLQSRLVFGDNIAQTAQFVQTGNAQVGIIALSLAINPELASAGGYWLIPDTLHDPLEQAFIITRHGGGNPLAAEFAAYMNSEQARAVMSAHGFVLPDPRKED